MQSNFSFLEDPWTSLSQMCMSAEKHLYDDPNACIMELGNFAECVTEEVCRAEKLPVLPGQLDRIEALDNAHVLPSQITTILHAIRKSRNDAVHHSVRLTSQEAGVCLRNAHILANWFVEYFDMDAHPEQFVMPEQESGAPRNGQTDASPAEPAPSPAPRSKALTVLAVLLGVSLAANLVQLILLLTIR